MHSKENSWKMENKRKRTAVVILNWNGASMLRKYLPGVIAHSQDEAEIIVADNASTDDTHTVMNTCFPNIRVINLPQNFGFAEGYNQALAQIEAEYYVLLNSDVEVTSGWLTHLTEYMDRHSDCAACQPKLRAVEHPTQFEYAGASGGMLDWLGYPFCRGRIFNTVEQDNGQYDDPHEAAWATGACLCVRSKDYWEAGGLDGRFFAHCEEIDLCWRLRILGRKVMVLPQSTVYHLGGGTLPKENPMKTFLNFRNNLTMIYKNAEEKDVAKILRWRTLLDWVAALQMLIIERNVAGFKAVIKARRAFKSWKNKFADDRKRIQQGRKVPDSHILYSHSILWKYYIKGIRQFSDL